MSVHPRWAADERPSVEADALEHLVQLRLVAPVAVALHHRRGARRRGHGVPDAA